MKKYFTRALTLLLAIAMVLSMVSCKKAKSQTKKPSTTESSSQAAESTESVESTDVVSDDADDTGDITEPDIPVDDFTDEVVVVRPNTEGSISTGMKISLDDGDIDNADDDEDDDIPIDDIDDIDDEPEVVYDQPIMKAGKAASSSTRRIEVNNAPSGIVFTDFNRIGTNSFPTFSTLESQIHAKTIEAYYDVQTKRHNDEALCYARSWFQIGWIITNEAGDDYDKYQDNWEANPDYQNYYNGIYDFNTDAMQSCIDYWRMLDESGTEVYLAYGWKIDTRIQYWFGSEPSRPKIAAPRDLKAYAKACKALFKYCKNTAGLTNFNTLSFYNEPDRADSGNYHGSWDFVTIGDKRVYWAKMAKECRELFKADSQLKDVDIMGADCSNAIDTDSEDYVNVYLRNHASDVVDAYTFHYYKYSNGTGEENPYELLFDRATTAYNYYNQHPCYVSECYYCDKDITKDYTWDAAGWNSSATSMFIALANTGFHGMFKWGVVGGYLLDPLFFDPANGETSSWIVPYDSKTADKVHWSYYQETLLNNYVKLHSNVHNLTWTGDDIRCAAFTTKDSKDFSLLVEANEDSPSRDLSVKLAKSLENKTIYIYKFDYNCVKDANAQIPALYDKIDNVTRTFDYQIDEDYGVYILTTIKPVKQVNVFDAATNAVGVVNECNLSGTVKLNAELVDCDAGDTVTWKICRYSCAITYDANDPNRVEQKRVCKEKISGADLGTINQVGNTVTYTPAADAKFGDVISLRCTINGTGGDRFAAAIIHIV